ncbi:uncharacterized protein si:dkeyp-69c1.9 [Epinephelus fuscoguttatus]|uniref:uncharacterized protein si:dkeyp-69c1.9 n=1 Tax=Epinephelus fuscoguttatus TaxID=293821 RepID=UPI0020D193BA|nr:uncharacterized protein si:dkeyp-69c1.9 [Epinephelus fuscoguttatus]XP_049448709.1 uncharacterized protein si:dkeyp-69c1.9 [Epinephelus fuscoguttatus]
MFIKNANRQNPRRHYEFFQRSRTYRGEPPAVAGFLLYPDTPAKMETTSREAFCFRPVSQQDRGKGDHIAPHTQQGSRRSHPTSSRQTGRGNSSRDGEPGEDEQEGDHDQTAVTTEPHVTEMQSQYQKDFPPPSSSHRRRTPAFPQPDNIGINPAFRIEFSTMQREHYPIWPMMDLRSAGRLREKK